MKLSSQKPSTLAGLQLVLLPQVIVDVCSAELESLLCCCIQVAGATGSLWAAEATWAAASKQVEAQQAAVTRANNVLALTLRTPWAKRAHKALTSAQERLEVCGQKAERCSFVQERVHAYTQTTIGVESHKALMAAVWGAL